MWRTFAECLRSRAVLLANDRRSHGRRAWLPLAVLLLALSSVFVFGGDRGHFYRPFMHDWTSLQDLALADSLFAKPFRFFRMARKADGRISYNTYNRRPIGTFVLVKLAILPFQGDISAQIFAARMLMLGFFVASAVLAHLSLARITGDSWVAAGATLLAFSSLHALGYADAISSECSPVLFALLLVFHGMVRFVEPSAGSARGNASQEESPQRGSARGNPSQEESPQRGSARGNLSQEESPQRGPLAGESKRRFAGLLLRVCVALLLAWQVYGLVFAFVAVGLGAAALAWWRTSVDRRASPVVARVFGRHGLLLGVAVVFGGVVLAYNVLAERSAHEEPIAELPSVRSALHRTGVALRRHEPEPLLTVDFYQWQFHRVGLMSLPYAAGTSAHWIRNPVRQRDSLHPTFAAVGVAVVAGCFLAMLLRRRRRLLPATLALGGFCWALPMRYNTVEVPHDFEALSYIGLPLLLYGFTLLALRRGRWGSHLVMAAVLGAALVFVLSSKAMAELGWSFESKSRYQALLPEFEAIREQVRGSDVLIASPPEAIGRWVSKGRQFYYYLAGSVVQRWDDLPLRGRSADFVFSLERVESDLLLTPRHRFVFLYRSSRALEEIDAARRRAFQRIAADEPVARSQWDVHLVREAAGDAGDTHLAFLKTPCAHEDVAGRFFVHVVPVDAGRLRQSAGVGFDNLDFDFWAHGVRFDSKCMVKIRLPDYEIASVRTGQFTLGAEEVWSVEFNRGAVPPRR